MKDKKTSSLRFSEEAKRIIALMGKKYGLSRTAVVEMALRELARKEKID